MVCIAGHKKMHSLSFVIMIFHGEMVLNTIHGSLEVGDLRAVSELPGAKKRHINKGIEY